MSDRYNPGDPYPRSPLWSSGARVHLTDEHGNRIMPAQPEPIDPSDIVWPDGYGPDADGRMIRIPDSEASE